MNPSQVDTFLNMRRTFTAPRDLVFRTWTEPKALEGWFRPMGSRQTKVAALDLRVGGGYCFEVTGIDGTLSEISGSYIEIARPEKLVFTWRSPYTEDHETLVTLRFVEHGNTTEVVLSHARFIGEQMMTAHEAGWNWMMEQLKTVF